MQNEISGRILKIVNFTRVLSCAIVREKNLCDAVHKHLLLLKGIQETDT